MTNLTPKQLAWNAFKAQDRKDRKTLRSLRLFGVPRRLRERCVSVRHDKWWLPAASERIVRVPRGRLSNPTALR